MAQPPNDPENRPASDKTFSVDDAVELISRSEARNIDRILRATTPEAITRPIERLYKTDTKDVQQIAGTQIELLAAYHQAVLAQSNRSFTWALIGSGFGLLLFAVAVGFSLVSGLSPASIVPLIAGAVVNVVSGVVFYLYGKTSTQLSAFTTGSRCCNAICSPTASARASARRSATRRARH